MSYDPDQLRELVLAYYQEGKKLERAIQRWSPSHEVKPRPSRATFYRAKARADEALVAQIEDRLREQPGVPLQACLDELSLPWARTTLSRRLRARGWRCVPDAGWLQVGTEDETSARFEPDDVLLLISCQDQVLILDRQQRVTCLGPRASCLGELAAAAAARSPERSWLKLLAWGVAGQTPQALLAQLRARHGVQDGSIRLDAPLMTWLLAAPMDVQRRALATPHWRALGVWLARLWLAYGMGILGALEQSWALLHDGLEDLALWDKTPAWCSPGWSDGLGGWDRGPWRALEALYPALGAWRVQMMTRAWFQRRDVLTQERRDALRASPLWERARAMGLPVELLQDDSPDLNALQSWLRDATQRSPIEQDLALAVFYQLAYWARAREQHLEPMSALLLDAIEHGQLTSSPGASARSELRNTAGLYERRRHRPLHALDHYLSAAGESGLSHHGLMIIALIYNIKTIYAEALLEEEHKPSSLEPLQYIDAIFEQEISWSRSSAQSQLSQVRDLFDDLGAALERDPLDLDGLLVAVHTMGELLCQAIERSLQNSYEQQLVLIWLARLDTLLRALKALLGPSDPHEARMMKTVAQVSEQLTKHMTMFYTIPEEDPRDLKAHLARACAAQARPGDDLGKLVQLMSRLDALCEPRSWDELGGFLRALR